MLRSIIIDDEPMAVESLALILKKKCRDKVQVIATTNSPQLGIELIEKNKPDLVFLDVEMPGISGIDLVRSFSNPSFKVVFVTAFDTYAIEAFRLSAVDYLLKPVDMEEVVRVVEKCNLENQSTDSASAVQLQNLVKLLSQAPGNNDLKIGIGMADKIMFVKISDILYCSAEGSYTHVFMADGRKIVASKTLGEFEQMLRPHDFFRIHHSTLINLRQIKEFQRFNGGYVVMENNEKLEVSHRKRNDFLDAIEGNVL